MHLSSDNLRSHHCRFALHRRTRLQESSENVLPHYLLVPAATSNTDPRTDPQSTFDDVRFDSSVIDSIIIGLRGNDELGVLC